MAATSRPRSSAASSEPHFQVVRHRRHRAIGVLRQAVEVILAVLGAAVILAAEAREEIGKDETIF